MIKYDRVVVPKGQTQVVLPGELPGLRIVGAKESELGIVLQILSPEPEGARRVYLDSGDQVRGFDKQTRIYVEVVKPGQFLMNLDANDFVTILGEGDDLRAVFASVRA